MTPERLQNIKDSINRALNEVKKECDSLFKEMHPDVTDPRTRSVFQSAYLLGLCVEYEKITIEEYNMANKDSRTNQDRQDKKDNRETHVEKKTEKVVEKMTEQDK